MSHDLLCSWLNLPPGSWPPNHYALLGLQAGESDVQRIEDQVHDRLLRLRSYQLNHADIVTEGMNRLAQAFTCLTDPVSKKAYDVALRSPIQSALVEPAPVTIASEVDPSDPLAWLFGPAHATRNASSEVAAPVDGGSAAAVQADWDKAPPPPRLVPAPAVVDKPVPPPVKNSAAPTVRMSTPADPMMEFARGSNIARRGLGTRRALFQRISQTRELLVAWEQAGKYIGQPARRLTRPAEAKELIRGLTEIRELLPDFPALLGEAGQPGYLVMALARQQMIVPTFRGLLLSQREALMRDWQAGRTLLVLHRGFLLEEIRTLRGKSILGRLSRALRFLFTDRPIVILLLLALLVLGVVVWASSPRRW